ncbi:MAG: gamma-glutamylcyclotransferase [Anaerolineae bacterium]|uniref:gamma-glutamylcyclotransferase family protein n=1 Tax=Promineifilum sp. TaxID=2664178 RepID=UPI001D7C9D6D|nr:gamma-glutamylcyclotransferase [Anaerolineales bacterium]MCB8934137.1 gamma-glutamylcyclotransferase [Promineifilum sp.]MCO5179759.1 gamma-glutamylcyclotransferase [Promineifilum sp.]MCW5845681.1 gamma-glutamylcyclotransferase [Anaerolineae bacterium]
MTEPTLYLPFFVYGTLLPGERNFGLWREAIADMRPAVLGRARLYDLGHFPMALDHLQGEVRGMVAWVRPSSYAVALSLLDQLEGVTWPWGNLGYRRARRIVRLTGGSSLVAWVYLGREAVVAGLEPIVVDWKRYRQQVVNAL